MPWSYYNTKYSQGEKFSLQSFLPIVESIWPYLQNTGSREESDKLKEQLNLLFQRKKLFLQLRIKEALSLLPQDKKALQEGLKLSPDNVAMLNLLAKLLISVPDPKLQDRKQALTLARHACAITEDKNPECLDILASAYATLGNFKKAAEIARKAYNLALSLNLKQLAQDIKKRLDTFERFQ